MASQTSPDEQIEQLKREKQALQEEFERLKRSEFRYRMIYDHSYVSIWEEDYTEVYALLERIKQRSAGDIKDYLRTHPATIRSLASHIKVLDVNDATLRMYNAASKAEFLGSLERVFAPDSTENFVHEMAAVANGKRYYEGETVGRKLTGELMNLLLRITIPEKAGRGDYSNVLVSLVDITARKRAEEKLRKSLEEKNILLMEIHHRVKNNLNIVASLLNLQSEQIDSVEQAREALLLSQSRIHSMAMVHEKLYQSADLAHIEMKSYVEDMVEELHNLYRSATNIEIDLQIGPFSLAITQAVPLALLLNELVTNTFLHAFTGQAEGKLRILFFGDSSGLCSLTVQDNGKGFSRDSSADDRQSLGLQLIEVLSEQLHGQAEFTGDSGTCFTLTFST
ncbi:MAG: sensor histidine kinase [Spirochaetota bacterium]